MTMFQPLPRIVVLFATFLLVLAASGIATAKGPIDATVTGHGIDEPIVISGTPDQEAADSFHFFDLSVPLRDGA